MWCISTMEYYSAIKRNKSESVELRMDLESIFYLKKFFLICVQLIYSAALASSVRHIDSVIPVHIFIPFQAQTGVSQKEKNKGHMLTHK